MVKLQAIFKVLENMLLKKITVIFMIKKTENVRN